MPFRFDCSLWACAPRTLFVAGALALASACANAHVAGDPVPSATTPDQGEHPAQQGNKPTADVVNPSPATPATGVRYIGRFGPALTMSWSNTAVELTFSGTAASLDFLLSGSGNALVGLSVDGGTPIRTPILGATELTTGNLSAGVHTVRATKLSEGRLGEITLTGTNITGTPAAAAVPSRRIEVIGDSIAAAYGIRGQQPNCINTFALEDAGISFASLSGNAVRADVSLIAWAGKGVLRNDVSDMNTTQITMPALWSRAVQSSNANYAFDPATAPQAVVIALGTNDYEYTAPSPSDATMQVSKRAVLDRSAFVSKYVALLTDVQGRYPNATFILCSSPMLSDTFPTSGDTQHSNLLQDLSNVVSAFKGASAANAAVPISVLDLPNPSPSYLTGCGGHPNLAGHAQLATLLTAELRSKLGW